MKKLLLLFANFMLLHSINLAAQQTAMDYLDQGRKHYAAGEFDEAIENFEAAVKLEPRRRIIWKELGDAYLRRGRYDSAIEKYNMVIQLNMEFDREEPEVWNTRGLAHRGKGDYAQAIKDFNKAVEINKDYTDALNNLGLIYFDNRDYDMAIDNFDKVIKIDRYHAQAWNNRSAAYLEKGDYDRAIADYTQLINFKANYDYAIVYSNRSRAYRGKWEYKMALADCEKALEINPNYAPALNNRALTYLEMGEYQKALDAFNESLDKAEKSGNINDISVYAWFLAGRAYEQFPYLKGGINTQFFWSEFGRMVLDGLGRGIKNAEDIRQSFGTQGAELMAQMIYLYYAGVDFEVVMGSPENIFFYSESLRSRGFLEQVGAEAAIRLPGVTEEEKDRFIQLRAKIEQQEAIAKLEGKTSERYHLAIRERDEAREQLAELDRILGGRIKNYDALRNPKPKTLNEAKVFCGDDRAVLEYVLWDGLSYKPIKGYESWNLKGDSPTINSYCLVITKNGLTAVRLEPGFDYYNMVQQLRNAFAAPLVSLSSYEKTRNDLYNQLIKPVLPYIQNIKNITIVPDGELAMIPFDILRADNNSISFGENHVVNLSPSLSVSMLPRKEGSMSYSPILFFANNIYADRKYPDGKDWGNLDFVEDEIDLLKKIAGGKNLEFSSYFRENATKESIKQLSKDAELRKFPVIHFACHGYFDTEDPTNSGLVLYQISGNTANINDVYLTIPEIAALDLDAKIVILSACETGLGKPKVGEGMVGLVRAFMVAGASGVGVSLWRIDDEATSFFMEKLYRKTLEEGKQFREAYKEVKEVFRSGALGFGYIRPYYWAPYIIYE